MEPVKYRLGTLSREPVTLSKNNRNISPSRNHHKAKQTRKVSTVSVQDDEKTENRISKYRSSLVETTQQMSDAQRFMRTCNFPSIDNDNLSIFEELPAGDENQSDEAVQHFTQMRLDEEQISQHLQRNEAIGSRRDENAEGGIKQTVKEKPNLSKDEEQKIMNFDSKLAQDYAFNIIGIMNLSLMNLTDHDIPMIIQRAFHEKKKKYFGLILRDNALTSEGVKMLVDAALTTRTNLKYLNFSNNSDIGDVGIEHLTRLLQRNQSITFLAVPNTGMTDRGVRILADTLCGVNTDSHCAPLEKLYISFNKSITDASLAAVLQIIKHNHTLKVLSLRHCSFSDKVRRHLRQVGIKMKKRKFSLTE